MATTAPAAPLNIHEAHPLELIPFFRRWPCGFWRDLVYTFIWNTGLALLFSMFALLWMSKVGIARVLWINFVYAQCVGYAIHGFYLVGYALLPREHLRSRAVRVVFFAGVPVLGVIAGFAIGAWLLGPSGMPNWLFSPRGLLALAVNSLLITGLLLAVMIPRERAAKAEAREQTRVAAAEREAALAQLKALEAQVEPHFLYNTLAHVASLIDTDPRQARGMLDRLISLLRATAKASNGGATLGGQADLLRAYLEILVMRMGPRLAWAIDVPQTLADAALPPALLQPLVENAIKHGLEPNVDGGRIDVSARERDGKLELVVADTGAGFGTTNAPLGGSTNLGLSVLKQRLRALYGDAATLTLSENRPSGVRATLRVPLQRDSALA
jgi:two-component sensor histidine kinase